MRSITWLSDPQGLHILLRLCGGTRLPAGLLVLAGGPYTIRLWHTPRIAVFEGGDMAAVKILLKLDTVAVTAGMGGWDCVTFSSVGAPICTLCIRREFAALDGTVIPEQEIAVRCASPGLPELLACTAAIALGLDISGKDII